MAKRKKQIKSRAKKPKRERRPIHWKGVIRGATTVAIALMFVGGGIAWAIGAQPLRQYVTHLDQQKLGESQLDLNWPTVAVPLTKEANAPTRAVPYVGEERAAAIKRDLHALVKNNPFDERSLEQVGVYLRDEGWLKAEGETVRRRPGNVIEVRGNWRLPRFVVRYCGYDYVVGDDFGLLPLREVAGSPVFADWGLRFIDGVYGDVPRTAMGEEAPGAIWQGADVRAAASLLDLLRTHADIWSQVAGVRVEPGDGAAVYKLTLITNAGCQIIWGRPPGKEMGIERSAADKIIVLQLVYDRTGRIDMGEALIDVRTGNYEIDRTLDHKGG